jgi:hypothetical protein
MEWPMPSFGWKLSLLDEVYVRRDYSEDPAHRLREVRVSKKEFDLLPKDGIPGFLALAIGLETALKKTPDLG